MIETGVVVVSWRDLDSVLGIDHGPNCTQQHGAGQHHRCSSSVCLRKNGGSQIFFLHRFFVSLKERRFQPADMKMPTEIKLPYASSSIIDHGLLLPEGNPSFTKK